MASAAVVQKNREGVAARSLARRSNGPRQIPSYAEVTSRERGTWRGREQRSEP
jgi:hypothetical protein